MSGQEIKRDKICNGDGGEAERLYGVKAGHVLTEQDARDIENLIADLNDEIGSSVEVYHSAYESAVIDTAPDKAELIFRINQLEGELSCEKALVEILKLLAE